MVSPSITQVLLGKGHPLNLQRNYRGSGGLRPGSREGRRTSSCLSSSSICWPYLPYSSHVEVVSFEWLAQRRLKSKHAMKAGLQGPGNTLSLGITNSIARKTEGLLYSCRVCTAGSGTKETHRHAYCVSHETLVFPFGPNDSCTD